LNIGGLNCWFSCDVIKILKLKVFIFIAGELLALELLAYPLHVLPKRTGDKKRSIFRFADLLSLLSTVA